MEICQPVKVYPGLFLNFLLTNETLYLGLTPHLIPYFWEDRKSGEGDYHEPIQVQLIVSPENVTQYRLYLS